MKQVYFVYKDPGADERRSDGVELCLIPEFQDEHIYFYCSEYVMFWRTIEEAGDFKKCCNFKLKGQIRPATLAEMCNGGFSERIDIIKEYELEGNKVKAIKYMSLR